MKYPHIKQHDEKDCGAACLSMICEYYGLKLPLTKFRNLIKVDNQGANMLMRHFADSTAGHTPSVITSQWKNADALDCKILQCTEKLNFAPADGSHSWSDIPIHT